MPLTFDSQTTHFQAYNALALALASEIAYEEKAIAKQRFRDELGLSAYFQPFEHHNFAIDTQGYVVAGKKHIVLAFRGTEPKKIKDWATDALAGPTEFRWYFDHCDDVGRGHAGFANSLSDAWREQILPAVKMAGAGIERTLWITGHSLGGALAVLAASACEFDHNSHLPVAGVYTYGQPRVGLRDFCMNLDADLSRGYYRFVNDRDVVPRLPPRAFDYTHTGRLIYFGSDGTPSIESVEHRSLLARAFGGIADIVQEILSGGEMIDDHSLTRRDKQGYIDRIRAAQAALTPGGGVIPQEW